MKNMLLLAFLATMGIAQALDFPETEITNGQIRAKVYLPDSQNGFYRATRFDWSGVVYSLQAGGHEYYGRWFEAIDPAVHDFVYKGSQIVSSPCTAITGPVDEFGALGWDEARPGGTFVKIGVGVLRKPDAGKYDQFRLYPIADAGRWKVAKTRESLEFTQDVNDSQSGYGYQYRKILRLEPGKPEMTLEHTIRNTGTRAIRTSVYNHNFFLLDGHPPGEGLVITVPFQIRTNRPPNKKLAEVRGNRIVYLKTLEGEEIVATPLQGFDDTPHDNDIRIDNEKLGAGMRITGDRPLEKEALWSIRAVMAMEPFTALTVDPGQEFRWTSTYAYYTLPH